jgi:hypothetical protein
VAYTISPLSCGRQTVSPGYLYPECYPAAKVRINFHTAEKNKNNGEIRGNLRKISPNLKIICIFAALKRI